MTASIVFGVIFALLGAAVLVMPRTIGDTSRGPRVLTFMCMVTLSLAFLAPR